MYSIIFQFVSTQVINSLHRREQKVTLFIITREGELLEQQLMALTNHGVTHINAEGCYLKEEKDLLYTVVSADEVKDVTALVRKLDPGAFLNIIRSDSISGRFYEEPLE